MIHQNYKSPHRFAIAPMIDWTDRHCRYFHRLFSEHMLLYTEMITTNAILHGDYQRLLTYNHAEHPVALQLGGSDPDSLAASAHIGEDFGYDEINLNVGCPSDRVQKGRFGACLMAEPNLVGDCIAKMRATVHLPITIKTRIGIDDSTEQEFLWQFIETVAKTGCETFIIHARKAWLHGLSPKENREIPPLNYPLVYKLKKAFPHLWISINGGISTLEEALEHLAQVDGVMLGRAAYHEPYLLAEVDPLFFATKPLRKSRNEVLADYLIYCEKNLHEGVALATLLRPILGLWHSEPGARKIRQILSNAQISSHDKMQFLNSLVPS